jgi:hypothetical protein
MWKGDWRTDPDGRYTEDRKVHPVNTYYLTPEELTKYQDVKPDGKASMLSVNNLKRRECWTEKEKAVKQTRIKAATEKVAERIKKMEGIKINQEFEAAVQDMDAKNKSAEKAKKEKQIVIAKLTLGKENLTAWLAEGLSIEQIAKKTGQQQFRVKAAIKRFALEDSSHSKPLAAEAVSKPAISSKQVLEVLEILGYQVADKLTAIPAGKQIKNIIIIYE